MNKLVFIATLISFSAIGCGDPMGLPSYNPETEQDYGPGFWDSKVDTTQEDLEGGETNTELPTPDELEEIEEAIHRKGQVQPFVSFPQTVWNECSGQLTGNYSTYACVKRRNIAVILNSFLQQRLLQCAEEAMHSQTGPGTAQSLHITHAGITGDPRHSPQSLHSFNRAIDVKVLKIALTNGTVRQYTYAKTGNRTFYTALRKCWGNVVRKHNGCPLYSGSTMLTGSIGWENRAHGAHMHLSVPYCYSGSYGPGAWRR